VCVCRRAWCDSNHDSLRCLRARLRVEARLGICGAARISGQTHTFRYGQQCQDLRAQRARAKGRSKEAGCRRDLTSPQRSYRRPHASTEGNPDVKIYVPQEPAVVIEKAPLAFFKREPGLTPRMSYYQGREPQGATGTPWYLYGDWRFPSRCDAAAGSRAHSFDLGRVAETQAGRAWPLHERAGPFRSGRSGERDQAALRRGQPYRGRRSRGTRELVLGQQRTGGATRHRVAPREEVHACRRYARP
jgi:hypothetical protein